MKKIYLIAFYFLLIGCKTSKDTVTPSSTLTIMVYRDSTMAAAGATVFVFSDQTSYQNAVASGDFSKATSSQTTASDGMVSFTGLSAQSYWVYVNYNNGGKAYNNTSSTYTLKNPLTSNSITTAQVYLKQSAYYVYFNSLQSSKISYPVKVIIGDTSFTLANSTSKIPALNKNPGIYSYQVSSNVDWTGTIVIRDNQSQDSVSVSLTPPVNGLVVFWTDVTPAAPINVYLTKAGDSLTVEPVGTINASQSAVPASAADTANTAHIYRDSHLYNYTAST